MTNQEASFKFDVDFDAIASIQAGPLEPTEKNVLLNNAMYSIIAQLGNVKAFDALTEITVVEKLTLHDCTNEELGHFAYQTQSPLSSQFLYYISSKTNIASRTVVSTSPVVEYWAKNEQITRDQLEYFAETQVNRQIFVTPKVYMNFDNSIPTVSTQDNSLPPTSLKDKILYILTDPYTLINKSNGLELVYLRKPVPIDIQGSATESFCELQESLHHAIIDLAVKLAMVSTDADRLKLITGQQQQQTKQ